MDADNASCLQLFSGALERLPSRLWGFPIRCGPGVIVPSPGFDFDHRPSGDMVARGCIFAGFGDGPLQNIKRDFVGGRAARA